MFHRNTANKPTQHRPNTINPVAQPDKTGNSTSTPNGDAALAMRRVRRLSHTSHVKIHLLDRRHTGICTAESRLPLK